MANNLGVNSYSIGGDFDVWGTKYVADMAIFNKMAGDTLLFPDTSGDIILDVVAMQNFCLRCNGSGSTVVNLRVLDGLSRFWYARNDRASGSMTVRCAAGGAAVTIPAGGRRLVASDGTDCLDLTLVSLAISSISGLQAALDAKQNLLAFAIASDILANVASKTINTDIAWASAVQVDLGNLSGTITPDFSTFVSAKGALTGNITLGQPSNLKKGQSGVLELTHSGGARTLTLNTTYWSSANGAAITLSTGGAGVKDLLGYYVMDNGKVLITPMALAVA